MLICRSQGHLLFSDWTISQRTVSVRAEARFRSCSVFQAPLNQVTLVDWDGKSSGCFDICKYLLKNFSSTCLLTSINPLCRAATKNVSSLAGANVVSFSICPNNGDIFFHFAAYGVLTATGNTLPLKRLCPVNANCAT